MPENDATSGNALDELIAHFPEVIDQIKGQEFTSHQFILELARLFQRDYVEALGRYLKNNEPFRALHAQISAELAESKYNLEQLPEVSSEDIFRQKSRCAAWRKRS